MRGKKIALYILWNVCLFGAIMGGILSVWMYHEGYTSQTPESFREEVISGPEAVGASIISLYWHDSFNAVNDFCEERGIYYSIYHVHGKRLGGNMSVNMEYILEDYLTTQTFDKSYKGYGAFDGIENYYVKLFAGKGFKPQILLPSDVEYSDYLELLTKFITYKVYLWGATAVSGVLAVLFFLWYAICSRGVNKQESKVRSLTEDTREPEGKKSKVEESELKKPELEEWQLPMEIPLGIMAGIIYTLCILQFDNREILLKFASMTGVVVLAINMLLLLGRRLAKVNWYRHTLCWFLGKGIWTVVKFLSEKGFTLLKTLGHIAIVFAKETAEALYRMKILYLGLLLIGCISGLELFCIFQFTNAGRFVLLGFLIEKVFLALLAINYLQKYQKLQDCAEKIADGRLDSQVELKGMPLLYRRLGQTLNAIGGSVANAISEKMKSEHFKTELITNVSHDLKTPLTSIINFSDLIQKEYDKSDMVKEYAEHLHSQSSRLKKLMEDLIEASKASTGNLQANLMPCDLRVIVGQCQGEYEAKLESKGIQLITKSCEEPAMIMADPVMLSRVFDNLMNNIYKYTQESTRVYISTERTDGKVRIYFKNVSKYAMDDVTAAELMERFVRGDLSRHSEGHGLGLSIVKSLMELQNGKVDISVDGDLFKVVLEFDEMKTIEKE